ncbi:MAG: alpha/beta hydrolase [Succinivibrio sp.]|nr:alpha/beta hydrolase [Succinivibrio sp.]
MEQEQPENLSEILFKPKFDYIETSVISNSGAALPHLEAHDPMLGFASGWYRPVHRFMWIWSGGNALDIDEALANIATSHGNRSREDCLDTQKDYGPGNWIYEFGVVGQRRSVLAAQVAKEGDALKASHHYRMAARYFAIAAYPNLRGDSLAADAMLLCRRNYRSMIEIDPTDGDLQELTMSDGERKFTAYLHLPDRSSLHPCVLILGSYEQNITDFYRFYRDALKPRGIAACVVDLPGLGASERLDLNSDTSLIVDKALDCLKELSTIDSTRIGLMGVRVGGTSCMRECLLKPQRVKALVMLEPAVHSMFTDPRLHGRMQLCLRSLYANRLNLDASSWETVTPQLQMLSLKVQGLLSSSARCKVPCYVSAVENSFTSAEDLKLIENSFDSQHIEVLKNQGKAHFLTHGLDGAAAFLAEKLAD